MKTNLILPLAALCAALALSTASAVAVEGPYASANAMHGSEARLTFTHTADSSRVPIDQWNGSHAAPGSAETDEGAPASYSTSFTALLAAVSENGSALAGLGLAIGIIVVIARKRSQRASIGLRRSGCAPTVL